MEPNNLKDEKPGSQLFLARKTVSQLFVERKSGFLYLEPKKGISQLFGTRKKRVTTISSQRNWLTAI